MKSENLSSEETIKTMDGSAAKPETENVDIGGGEPAKAAEQKSEVRDKKKAEKPQKAPKGSLFGISGAFMGTLIRRHWIASLITLFMFFLSVHMPLIIGMNAPDEMKEFTSALVSNSGMVGVNTLFIAVIIAVSAMIFDYLHSQDSAMLMHSLPINRGRYFRTAVLTGYMMLLIPLILSAAGLFVLSSKYPDLSTVNIIKWFIDEVLVLSFNYSVANLAAVLAGAVWSHILMAFVFMNLPDAILFVVNMYKSSFIFGMGEFDGGMSSGLTPESHYVLRANTLTFDEAGYLLAFFGAAIAITVISGLLYKRIKLEREKRTTVFPLVGDILVMVFTFLSMSIVGFMLALILSDGGSMATFTTSFLAGAGVSGAIFFIIYRMIADSSGKVFNFKNIVKFLIFCAITAGIFAVSVFDVLGIAKTIPDASEVKRVRVGVSDMIEDASSYEVYENDDSILTMVGDEAIKNSVELHRFIIDNETKFANTDFINADDPHTIFLSYTLKDGRTIERMYSVNEPDKDKKLVSLINRIVTTDEFIEAESNMLTRRLRNAKEVMIEGVYAELRVTKDQWEALLGNYIADLDVNGIKHRLGYLSNEAPFPESHVASISFLIENESWSAVLPVGPEDKNTMKFLKQNGYYKSLIKQDVE